MYERREWKREEEKRERIVKNFFYRREKIEQIVMELELTRENAMGDDIERKLTHYSWYLVIQSCES